MNFILPFNIPKALKTIGYNNKVLCIGSCFAQEIGVLMNEHKFDVLLNPHGILFNSFSIVRAIDDYIENKVYNAGDLMKHNNIWHSLYHHGNYSDADAQKCLYKINSGVADAHNYLKKADWLCITLGTSWVYTYKPTGSIIANCHKIPQDNFTRTLKYSNQQTDVLQDKIARLRAFNPKIKILFTVSPVKYIRDGIIENNLSKAHLISTVHALCNLNEDCFYFPAYELVTDVLRDYRFYKEDLVHPNAQAIKFVWEHFIKTFFGNNDMMLFEEISSWLKFNNHRSLSDDGRDLYDSKRETMEHAIEEKLSVLRSDKI